MLSAKDARRLTEHTYDCPYINQIHFIQAEIIKVAEIGKYKITLELENIYIGTIKILKENGYRVKIIDNILNISWEEYYD